MTTYLRGRASALQNSSSANLAAVLGIRPDRLLAPQAGESAAPRMFANRRRSSQPTKSPIAEEGQSHRYVISEATSCSAPEAFERMRAANTSAPGAAYAKSGFTRREVLPINNPISQMVDPSSRTIVNQTLPGHIFYPGTVTIRTEPSPGHGSRINIVGVGTGRRPWLNNAVGRLFFGNAAASVAQSCVGTPAYMPVHGG